MRMMRAIIAGAMVLTVAACSSGDEREIKLRKLIAQGNGPDEFSILPSKPLQSPSDLSALPTPTPGGSNLTDQNPIADAVSTLGGRPSAMEDRGVPGSDAALVRHASRKGVPGDIRATVAAEDKDYRKSKGRFQKWRIFVKNKYNETYKNQTLDSWETNQGYRRVGVPTPSVPPAGK